MKRLEGHKMKAMLILIHSLRIAEVYCTDAGHSGGMP